MCQTINQEKTWWDAAGRNLDAAKQAIWGDAKAWEGGSLQEYCFKHILPAIQPCFHDGARVLDLGCGIGRLTIPIAASFPKIAVVGVDVSEKMLRSASEQTPKSCNNVEWMLCDGRNLPDHIGQLNAAFSMIMLQHIPREAAHNYIVQMGNCLTNGGIFRFQVLEGGKESFLCHQVDLDWIEDACAAGKMRLAAVDRVAAPVDDPGHSWLWITARGE